MIQRWLSEVQQLVREMWLAATLPLFWFKGLEPDQVRIPRALLAMLLTLLATVLMLSISVLIATASDALLLLLWLGLLLGLASCIFLVGFGGLAIQRQGTLDVRAWELISWSWAPAFFVSVSLLPVLLLLWVSLLPQAAAWLLIFTALLLIIGWHLWVLRVALGVFTEARATRILLLYILLIFLFPLAIMLYLLMTS